MGYYEDHIQAVADRMAERLKKGLPEWRAKKYLVHTCEWSEDEAERIIRLAYQKCAKTAKPDTPSRRGL